jgi:hypothetical protein
MLDGRILKEYDELMEQKERYELHPELASGVNGLSADSFIIEERLFGKPFDDVEQPEHYVTGGIEAIDIIKAKLTPEEFRGFLKGNVMKYTMRSNYKGQHDKDCSKAAWYADELEDFNAETQETTTRTL